MKYTTETVELIKGFIESGEYTIKEICTNAGINIDTFYDWKNNKPEFSEIIKKAELVKLEKYKVEARKSMLKKIQGYTVEEVRTSYVDDGVDEQGKRKPRIREKTITQRHFQPDTAMIIFTLTNTDSDNFKNSHHVDHTSKGKELPKPVMCDLNNLPDELVRNIIKHLRESNNRES